MLEGSIFLFCTWFIWIITTFFMDKDNKKRTQYSVYILVAIILSPFKWEWQNGSCSVLLLIILIISFFYTGRLHWKTSIYIVLSSFFMMLAYTTYELMAIIDPIWVFLPDPWLKACILFVLVILLHRNFICQMLTLLIGNISGEILLNGILSNYQREYFIGSMSFFDFLMLGVLGFLSLFYIRKKLVKWEQHVFMLEKERQKNI